MTRAGPEAPPAERPPEASRAGGLARVLRRPQFSLLVVGQTVSQLGDKLHHMALIALVGAEAEARTSGFAFSQLAVVFTLPMLFGPLAGALVDRWNKRVTMIVCDVIRAIIVALIPLLYRYSGHLWPVYVVAFFVFLLGVFFNSAKMALIPDLVSHDTLLPANAALTLIGRVATVTGIVGGGLMIGWSIWRRFGLTGYEAGFYMDAASYVVSVLSLVLITIISAAHARRAALGHWTGIEAAALVRREFAHLTGDMRQTVTFVRANPELRFVFGTIVLLGALAASIYVVMTSAVQNVMQQGPRGVGFLGGVAAAGMIVGSLVVGTVGSRWNKRHIILVGCLLVGALMIVGGMFFSFGVFMPIALVGGTALAPIMVSQDTLVHESAPAEARALIFSTRELVLGASFMISALLVGGGISVLGYLGAHSPHRLALLILGVLICAAAMAGEVVVLRRSHG